MILFLILFNVVLLADGPVYHFNFNNYGNDKEIGSSKSNIELSEEILEKIKNKSESSKNEEIENDSSLNIKVKDEELIRGVSS